MELFFEVIIVGLVLSADSFSAALAMGFKPHTTKDVLRFAFSSGFAEGLVTFLGAIFGAKILARFDSIDHWVSFVLIMAVALHMVWEGIEELRGGDDDSEDDKGGTKDQEQNQDQDEKLESFHSYYKVLIVSLATSLDAFAVGVSLGTTGKPLAPFVASIGTWAFLSTIVGMAIARRASKHIGAYFSFIGALVLMGIAIKLLF